MENEALKKEIDEGNVGELLVSDFFDKNFSKIYSFPNPKTKNNSEVADVLIWLNRTVFLIEVKTRSMDGTAPIESWAHTQIKKAYTQINKNFQRIKSKEEIFLKNAYYDTKLDCEEVVQIIGLVILVSEEKCIVEPTEYLSEIYANDAIPIHVITWDNLELMLDEIDTVPDFIYYLQDRFQYLKISNIPTGKELDVLGYYKSQSNKFPKVAFDFTISWKEYKTTMQTNILIRNQHNTYSQSLDKLEEQFIFQRKLYDGIPLGMYFAWELGTLSRREKAYYGEKINSVFEYFSKEKNSRKFSVQSGGTKNWLLFHFSKSSEKINSIELERLCKLKLVKEMHLNSFEFGVYAFAFEVSDTYPYQIMSIITTIMMGVDVVTDMYNQENIELALKEFGDEKSYFKLPIKEFIEV